MVVGIFKEWASEVPVDEQKKYRNFYHHDKTIGPLFFNVKPHVLYGQPSKLFINLYPRYSDTHIFGNWLHGIDQNYKISFWVRRFVVVCSLWLWGNDLVFNGKNYTPLYISFTRCNEK